MLTSHISHRKVQSYACAILCVFKQTYFSSSLLIASIQVFLITHLVLYPNLDILHSCFLALFLSIQAYLGECLILLSISVLLNLLVAWRPVRILLANCCSWLQFTYVLVLVCNWSPPVRTVPPYPQEYSNHRCIFLLLPI